MKMAKPSAQDISAADELHSVLEEIDTRWGGPYPHPDSGENLPELLDGEPFDSDDLSHLRTLYNHLARLLRTAPNFHGRVLTGMCHVILAENNEVLDPALDYLELHPKLIAALAFHNASLSRAPGVDAGIEAAFGAGVEP